jgi:hypothetical protein
VCVYCNVFFVVNNGTINEVMLIKFYGLIALTLRCSNIYKQIILLKMMCMNRSGKNFIKNMDIQFNSI